MVHLPSAYPVLVDHIVGLATVQHLPVPIGEPLRLGDLLIIRVAVENVVIPFTGRARPYVSRHEPGRKGGRRRDGRGGKGGRAEEGGSLNGEGKEGGVAVILSSHCL